jgi:hypothetical protein
VTNRTCEWLLWSSVLILPDLCSIFFPQYWGCGGGGGGGSRGREWGQGPLIYIPSSVLNFFLISGPHICLAGTLPLEPLTRSFSALIKGEFLLGRSGTVILLPQ